MWLSFANPVMIAALGTILIALVRILCAGAVTAFIAFVEGGMSDIGISERGHNERCQECRKNSDWNSCQFFQGDYLPKKIDCLIENFPE